MNQPTKFYQPKFKEGYYLIEDTVLLRIRGTYIINNKPHYDIEVIFDKRGDLSKDSAKIDSSILDHLFEISHTEQVPEAQVKVLEILYQATELQTPPTAQDSVVSEAEEDQK